MVRQMLCWENSTLGISIGLHVPRSCSSAFSREANACVISSRASSFGAAASSAESWALSGLRWANGKRVHVSMRVVTRRCDTASAWACCAPLHLDHHLRPRITPRGVLRRREGDLGLGEIADWENREKCMSAQGCTENGIVVVKKCAIYP